MSAPSNTLYYGDNLEVLRRYIPDHSVDLIYLDSPFNSRQDYNVLFAEKDGTRSAVSSSPLRTVPAPKSSLTSANCDPPPYFLGYSSAFATWHTSMFKEIIAPMDRVPSSEIIIAKRSTLDGMGYWFPPGATAWKKPGIRATSCGLAFGTLGAYLLSQFPQLRGIVSVIGSKFALYGAAICFCCMWAGISLNLPRLRKVWCSLGILMIFVCAVFVDQITLPRVAKSLSPTLPAAISNRDPIQPIANVLPRTKPRQREPKLRLTQVILKRQNCRLRINHAIDPTLPTRLENLATVNC